MYIKFTIMEDEHMLETFLCLLKSINLEIALHSWSIFFKQKPFIQSELSTCTSESLQTSHRKTLHILVGHLNMLVHLVFDCLEVNGSLSFFYPGLNWVCVYNHFIQHIFQYWSGIKNSYTLCNEVLNSEQTTIVLMCFLALGLILFWFHKRTKQSPSRL